MQAFQDAIFRFVVPRCFARIILENFLTVLNALFWVFVRRVAVYLLRSVESSGLLYAAGGNSSKLFHLLSPYSDFRTLYCHNQQNCRILYF